MTILARVFFVRHGETDSNRNRIVQGQLDTQLNATGLAQAVMTAEALKASKVQTKLLITALTDNTQ